jgi:integrase
MTGTEKDWTVNITTIKALPLPPEGQYKMYWDDNLTGFGVRITGTGAISFIVQSRVKGSGKVRRRTIGSTKKLTPTQARAEAKKVIGELAMGIDRRAEEQEQKANSVTLREVTDDYLVNRRTKKDGLPLKQNTKNDIDRHIKTTFSDWENKPIAGITRDMVRARYSERCKTSVAQANQSMRVLGALIRYTAVNYFNADKTPIITDNPVDVLKDGQTLRGVPKGTKIVPVDKRGEWWSEVQRRRKDPSMPTASRTAVDLMAFIALTGLRLTEAKTLMWPQVDLDDKSFKLIDTKNRRDMTFPLSDVANLILSERRENGSAYVFPGRSSGHLDNATKQFKLINKATGVEVSAHPLRRTFIQIGLKALKPRLELWQVKALSNHKQTDDITLEYGDLTDVRSLKPEADRIAEYYEAQRLVFEADNVVQIGERRA